MSGNLVVRRWTPDAGFEDVGRIPAGRITWARGPMPPPEYFVGWTTDGSLEIRRTEDGSVVRTLSDDIGVPIGKPTLAVSDDNEHVYVDGLNAERCPDDPT